MSTRDFVNVEAEQSVLGTLLVEEGAFDECSDILDPALFGIAAHRAVCEVVIEAARARKPYDAITVTARLEERGLMGDPVPRELPFTLARAVGTTANMRAYVEDLRSLWAHRQVRLLARKILADERDLRGEELVADAARSLSVLEVRRQRKLRLFGESVDERILQYERARTNPEEPSLLWSTGLRQLDGLIGGFQAGRLYVVGARPNVGKTALMLVFADNLASQGVPVGIFELEDEEVVLVDRAISRRARIAGPLLRGNGRGLRDEHFARMGEMEFQRTLAYPLWVDDEHGLFPEDVAARMRRMSRENGVKVFFLDHVRELRLRERRDGRHDLALGDAVRSLRDVAKDLGAALVVFSQLTRDIEKRADPTPRLSDLRDSGDIEAAARCVMFLAKADGQFIIDVAKNTGPKGQIVLNWLEDYNAIEDRAGY